MQTSLWNSNSIQTLFGGGATGIFGSLGDYSLIKSGEYGKLMKAYYNQMKTESSTQTSKTSSSKDVLDKILNDKKQNNVSQEATKANMALKSGMSALSSSMSTLQNSSTYETATDGKSIQDKVVSAVKDYVNNYNKIVSNSKNSTLSNLTNNVSSIMKDTTSNASKLNDIGVNVNYDGTLSIDEKKLKAADISKTKELFTNDNSSSYGSKVNSAMNRVGYYNRSSNIKNDTTAQDTKTSAIALKDIAKTLALKDTYKKKKDINGVDTNEYDRDNILSNVQSFVKNYNDTIGYAKNSTNIGTISNLSSLQSKTSDNASALSDIGISIGNDGKLSLNENTFNSVDIKTIQNAFENYGTSISTNASLIGFYASSQTNGYTTNGTYNNLNDPNSIFTSAV